MKSLRDKWLHENYNKYWSCLYLYAVNILRDQNLAMDVVQDVYIYIWTNYDSLTIVNTKGYLIQCVKNMSLKQLAKSEITNIQIETLYPILVDNEVLTTEQEEEFKKQLVALVYKKAQEILPSKCFEIFSLRFYKGMSYKEIATKLHITESTIENQINKALKVIKASMPEGVDFVIIIGIILSQYTC